MRAITLPFRLDGYGNVASTTDINKIWADRVRTVVSTQPSERVMRPEFGCPMPENLFVAITTVPELVEGQTADAFTRWLPGLKFEKVETQTIDEGEGSIEVGVFYSIPTVQQNTDSPLYSIVI